MPKLSRAKLVWAHRNPLGIALMWSSAEMAYVGGTGYRHHRRQTSLLALVRVAVAAGLPPWLCGPLPKEATPADPWQDKVHRDRRLRILRCLETRRMSRYRGGSCVAQARARRS